MRIAIALTTFLLAAVPASASTGTAWRTPFDLLPDGSLVVPVTIGGTGPYRFVLDTGSSRTVIAASLSTSLRLPVVAKTRMVTPAGANEAYVVRLTGLAVGQRPEVTVSAAMMPADRYAAGQQVHGLIGQDVLAAVVYTIDYVNRVVVWHAPDELLPGRRLPLDVRDNRVLVTLAQRDGDPRPLSMIPDTGSDGLVLFAHAQDKVRTTPLDVGVLATITGSTLARRVEIEGLVVGEARLQRPLAVIVETGEPVELMGDGLLPLHVFSRVTFNVGERYLIVR